MLLTCQAGFETLLARELAATGGPALEQGPGWVRTEGAAFREELAFPWLELMTPVEVRGESVNALAQRVAEFFFASLKGERVEADWPCVWLGPQEITGLGRRISAVESAFGELLKKKLSRVAKLAKLDVPRARRAGCLFTSRISAGCGWPGKRTFMASAGWRMTISRRHGAT